jgi:nucleotide-binding universal stress UspA family protein
MPPSRLVKDQCRDHAACRELFMLNSVLLHLENVDQAQPVIRVGVALARQAEARLRGLTLLDTRRFDAAFDCESAGYAVMEHTRHALTERIQETVRARLSQACLEAGLNFDVRRSSGDPLQVLSQEARFHDLVVTSVVAGDTASKAAADWSVDDLTTLLDRGVQPLLVVQSQQVSIDRVLLVYDGSEAAGRAIRSFLNQGIFTDAEHRLLAVGSNESAARDSLRSMADYCCSRRRELETGYAHGTLRGVLLPYAKKWQADLIVMGVEPGNRLLRWMFGNPTIDVLKKLSCGLYATA